MKAVIELLVDRPSAFLFPSILFSCLLVFFVANPK